VSGGLARRKNYEYRGMLVPQETYGELIRIGGRTLAEQAVIGALAEVGRYAFGEIESMTRLRNTYETTTPDAAEALALISAVTINNIARSVSQFGSRLTQW
jgi:hypothetical protein